MSIAALVLAGGLALSLCSKEQSGVASWYGPGFDGRSTANGETYDENRLTAASLHLPLSSPVIVTNLRNGRRVMLRVNDRGPYVHHRLIDVSAAAARALHFWKRGVTRVRVSSPCPIDMAYRAD